MLTGFSIEAATHKHVNDIRALELAGAAMFSFEDLPQSIRYRVTDIETLATAIREARLWVANTSSGRTIGFALAEIVDGEVHLSEIDVLPEQSRRGVGTCLVKRVCEWARERGSDAVTLTTFRHIPWNAPFYAKLGFETIPESEIGPDLSGLMREEAAAGLDCEKRVCMRFLPRQSDAVS